MAHRTACLATVCIGMSVVASIGAQDRSSGSRPAALTATDHIEIQQLVARFSYNLDSAANNGSAFSELFTADGTFGDAAGRERLSALVRENVKTNPTTRHFVTNVMIASAPGGASGTQYEVVFEVGKGGKQSEIVRTGRYEDTYLKTPQGWRFKTREFFASTITSEAAKAALPESQSPRQSPIIVEPQRLGAPTTLTPDDYLAITRLVASYGHALDNGFGRADNGDAYAELFTPDGVAFQSLRGHEPLAAIARAQPHTPRYVRHFLTNVVIAPSPEGAIGRQYLAVIDGPENGKPGSLFLGGRYEDIYVKTSNGWRFKSRTLIAADPGQATEPSPAPISLSDNASRASTGGVTAIDYIEIQQLLARYAFALDTGADNGYAYADLYAPDGMYGTTKGRDELASLVRGGRPAHVRTFAGVPMIEPSVEGARGVQYSQAMNFSKGGRSGELDHFGRYDDIYVKTPNGWRFKSRTFIDESLAVRSATQPSKSR